jgi:hypothetical protein
LAVDVCNFTEKSMRTLSATVFLLIVSQIMFASGHGPVFGLATPTNPKGGWSFDANLMGRGGDGSGVMFRPALGYGLTENLKVSISAPVVFQAEPFTPSRLSAFTSMSGDFEGIAIWRFHRQDTGVGSRFESAAIGGVLLPGSQHPGGPLRNVTGGAGGLIGGVTGIASRSHYAWGGATYQRYSSSDGDRRPDLLFYSLAYAYRPPSWRTDSGWDWRIFAEMTGERSGNIERAKVTLPGSDSHQVFLGPTTLGVFKNYAVSAGIQFPVYRSVSPIYPRERVRFAVNFAYFF